MAVRDDGMCQAMLKLLFCEAQMMLADTRARARLCFPSVWSLEEEAVLFLTHATPKPQRPKVIITPVDPHSAGLKTHSAHTVKSLKIQNLTQRVFHLYALRVTNS